jgi:hypothetical protein
MRCSIFDLLGFLLKDINKLTADELPLLFGIRDSLQAV